MQHSASSIYNASFLSHDHHTDAKSINAISKIAQTVVAALGIEDVYIKKLSFEKPSSVPNL